MHNSAFLKLQVNNLNLDFYIKHLWIYGCNKKHTIMFSLFTIIGKGLWTKTGLSDLNH